MTDDQGSTFILGKTGDLKRDYKTFQAASFWMQDFRRFHKDNLEKLCGFVAQTGLDQSPEYSEKVKRTLENFQSRLSK